MSIEVRVPSDLDSYKEKVIAGLSLRQLLWCGVALVIGSPTFFILKFINEDLALYTTLIVAAPAVLMGFYKKDGYNFEQYLKIQANMLFNKQIRGYAIKIEENAIPYEIEEFRLLVEEEKEKERLEELERIKRGEKINSVKKNQQKRKKRTGKTNFKEHSRVEISKKSFERKRKATYKKITNAGSCNRKAKREAKKEKEKRSST